MSQEINCKGTPSTLKQAIENGAQDSNVHGHILEFIRQKFATSVIKAGLSDNNEAVELLFQTLKEIEGDDNAES